MAQAGRLAGEVAIVTAGGQGLGEAIAKRFAQEGARVAVVDINAQEATRVATEIMDSGGAAFSIEADVTRSDKVASVVKIVVDRWGTVDILVNAAGGFHRFAPITEIEEEEWDRVINVNLKSTFLCTKAVAGIMMQNKKGRIINIASLAGIGPNPHAPSYLPYGAAKAGVIGFAKLLARDIGAYGVTVNNIAPGTTLTPRVRKVRDAASVKQIAERNAMKCLVEPEDTAEAALFLASDAARHMTGTTLNVSAGNIIL